MMSNGRNSTSDLPVHAEARQARNVHSLSAVDQQRMQSTVAVPSLQGCIRTMIDAALDLRTLLQTAARSSARVYIELIRFGLDTIVVECKDGIPCVAESSSAGSAANCGYVGEPDSEPRNLLSPETFSVAFSNFIGLASVCKGLRIGISGDTRAQPQSGTAVSTGDRALQEPQLLQRLVAMATNGTVAELSSLPPNVQCVLSSQAQTAASIGSRAASAVRLELQGLFEKVPVRREMYVKRKVICQKELVALQNYLTLRCVASTNTIAFKLWNNGVALLSVPSTGTPAQEDVSRDVDRPSCKEQQRALLSYCGGHVAVIPVPSPASSQNTHEGDVERVGLAEEATESPWSHCYIPRSDSPQCREEMAVSVGSAGNISPLGARSENGQRESTGGIGLRYRIFLGSAIPNAFSLSTARSTAFHSKLSVSAPATTGFTSLAGAFQMWCSFPCCLGLGEEQRSSSVQRVQQLVDSGMLASVYGPSRCRASTAGEHRFWNPCLVSCATVADLFAGRRCPQQRKELLQILNVSLVFVQLEPIVQSGDVEGTWHSHPHGGVDTPFAAHWVKASEAVIGSSGSSNLSLVDAVVEFDPRTSEQLSASIATTVDVWLKQRVNLQRQAAKAKLFAIRGSATTGIPSGGEGDETSTSSTPASFYRREGCVPRSRWQRVQRELSSPADRLSSLSFSLRFEERKFRLLEPGRELDGVPEIGLRGEEASIKGRPLDFRLCCPTGEIRILKNP